MKETHCLILFITLLLLSPAQATAPVAARECLVDTKNDPTLFEAPMRGSDYYFKYVNPRFKYSIEFPGWLIAQAGSQNADGRKFVSTSGECELLVYGRSRYATVDAEELNIKLAFMEELKRRKETGDKVTYKVRGNSSFVVSGVAGKNIFYEKTIFSKDSVTTFEITYPEGRKADYDKTVSYIANSFKIGK
ncbi:MAG: hypothetical protein K8F91_20790 [Candidatus Obscuribacterales bacterium]|nr:hypothetical protein [Candidatus Obscuribacterales bacterium]